MSTAAHETPAIFELDHLLRAADPSGVPELRAVLAELLRPIASARFVEDRMIWRSRVHRARFVIDDVERSLILKRLPLDRAHREQLVLRRWLPQLGLSAHGSPLLGVAAAPGGECIWHVYEDLGPQALDAQKPDAGQILAAVQLLARLHVRSATCGFLGECREFGVDLGAGFLRAGIADSWRALAEIRSRASDLDQSQRLLFDRLLERLCVLRAEEPDRTRVLLEHGGPEVLLHGDLWTCNIFGMPSAADLPVRFIDWDHAGVGYASYDLSALLLRFPLRERNGILASYAEQVAQAGWRLPDHSTLNALFASAETARLVSAVLWPALAFLDHGAGWAVARLAEVESWFDQLGPVLAIDG